MNLLQQPITLLLLFCLGVTLQWFAILHKDIAKKINRFILYVPLPAIVLEKIPQLEMNHEVLFPIASAWIIFFASAIFAYLFCKWNKYDNKTMACIILSCGLGNTSFVGYPFLRYFYGEESLRYAIFVDQPGSFLILSTFGVLVATYFSATNFSIKSILMRLLKFPPFLIFIIALFIPKNFIPNNTVTILEFLGKWMVPLAILSLGLQFDLSLKNIPWKKLSAGLLYKLILAPLIIYFLFIIFLKKEGELYTISIIECAMPPMITSSILAIEYKLDEKLASSLPTIGILVAFPTLLLWKYFLSH